jgi:hypothetical protein
MTFDVLVNVIGHERKVEDEGDPVAVDEKEECEEAMDGCFWDDVCVQAVAEIDWVDIVTVGISQHMYIY